MLKQFADPIRKYSAGKQTYEFGDLSRKLLSTVQEATNSVSQIGAEKVAFSSKLTDVYHEPGTVTEK